MNRPCRMMCALAAAGVLAAGVRAADVLSDLGVREPEARDAMIGSLMNGGQPGLGAQVFKAAPPARRTALVQGAFAWAKAFAQTAAFKTSYDAARNDRKPQPPEKKSADPIAQQRAEFEKSIAEMRANVAGQSAEMKKIVEDSIKQTREMLDAMTKDPEQAKAIREGAAAEQAEAQAKYEADLKQYSDTHPTDPKAALAAQLRRFVAECGAVDFDAKLVPSPTAKGVMLFANSEYEKRSPEWKFCYRAGREPIAAALAATKSWLAELR